MIGVLTMLIALLHVSESTLLLPHRLARDTHTYNIQERHSSRNKPCICRTVCPITSHACVWGDGDKCHSHLSTCLHNVTYTYAHHDHLWLKLSYMNQHHNTQVMWKIGQFYYYCFCCCCCCCCCCFLLFFLWYRVINFNTFQVIAGRCMLVAEGMLSMVLIYWDSTPEAHWCVLTCVL